VQAQCDTSIPVFDVISPGLLTTVQDAGRPDSAPLGVPPSGAADPLGLAAANLLAGNAVDAAALELSLLGPQLRVLRSTVIGLTGADFQANVVEEGRALRPGSAHALNAGTTISFDTALDGARGYLAVSGGIAVAPVLGSASTALGAGFGGVEGRALVAGDLISAYPGRSDNLTASSAGRRAAPRWPGPGPSSGVPAREGAPGRERVVEIRVVRGPHAEGAGGKAWDRLTSVTWEVDSRSDRTGVRLLEPGAGRASGATDASYGAGLLVSMPMTWGAIQLPPGGAPICLLADHPTVGGYPVVAVVATVDRPLLGQLRAPHRLRLVPVDMADAQAALLRAEQSLEEAGKRLRPAEPHG
jgi:antagonist of KipI